MIQITLPVRGHLVRGIEKPQPVSKRNLSLYGKRDTRCIQCRKHFRATDINASGVCLWCEYDNKED